MAYNPYGAASKIVGYKDKWSQAYKDGGDTSGPEQDALTYYNELRANGRSDVADELSKRDNVSAADYLKTLATPPAPGTSTGSGSNKDGTYNPYKDIEGVWRQKIAYDESKATGADTSAAASAAKSYYKQLEDNGYSDVANYLHGIGATETGEYIKRFVPSYDGSAEGNQAKSNDVYKAIKDGGDEIKTSWDDIYRNNINVNPLGTDYGKAVMGAYGTAADGAYSKSLGGGTEDAGGNADSYAAANANRQKAAVIAQGNADVLNYYNAISGRATDWASGKSNAISGNLAQLQGNVDNDRAARQADDALAVNQYLRELQTQADAANAEADRANKLYLQELINNGNLAVKQQEGSNDLAVADVNGQYDVLGREITGSYGLKESQTDAQAKRDAASISAGATKYKADKDAETARYKADNSGTNKRGNGKFASTIQQIISGAKSQATTTDKYGQTVFDKDACNKIIQALLDDDSYDVSEREALRKAYAEQTGVSLSVGPSGGNGGISDGLWRRLDNQPRDDDKIAYVSQLLDSGVIDEEQADVMLSAYGLAGGLRKN